MKRLIISILVSIAFAATSSAADNGRANPRSMSFPPLRYDIPRAERVVLECGMPVYLLRDPELPIINMTAMVRSGSVYEPASLSGLASLTGNERRDATCDALPSAKSVPGM